MTRITEILATPTASDLTTVASVRGAIGEPPDAYADAYIVRQIAAASSVIIAECGRPFGRERIRDTFQANGPVLLLSRTMLLDPPGMLVEIAGQSIPFSLNAGAGLLYRTAPLPWRGCVTVTYTAGWLLPGQDGCTLPAAIEDAAIDRVVSACFARGRDPGISRERVENVGDITYTKPGTTAPSDPRLDPYRIIS